MGFSEQGTSIELRCEGKLRGIKRVERSGVEVGSRNRGKAELTGGYLRSENRAEVAM
jgi:hypothetical protein